uniref:cyclic AMP-responsive element-binding protein 3-like protein 4 n=1 Tax=Styela clava TaxID=7725 RepID=UPI00193A88F3|nr:cyclic AMP-responsive element-binding protein 3-like protein 4 [Styela clava]
MDLDLLENCEYNYLDDASLSELFGGCADVNINFNYGDGTNVQDMSTGITDADDFVQNWINAENVQSDHDYAGCLPVQPVITSTEDFTCNVAESMSDSGVSSLSPCAKSPISSDCMRRSPCDFSNGTNSPPSTSSGSSDAGSENHFSLNDLQFDFSDIDMEKVVNSFPVAGDDILDSCFKQSSNNLLNENVCIELDDTLSSLKQVQTHRNTNQKNCNKTPAGKDSLPLSPQNVSKAFAETKYRCTLPNFKPLRLTGEELKLLEEENVTIPTDLPLTKSEEKVLKRVRRKIRNKKSAMESRKRRKEYLGGLENRVSQCTMQNSELLKKVKDLENENQTLLSQLKRLQDIVRSTSNKTTQATTCVMVLLLSFGLFLAPNYGPFSINQEDGQTSELDVTSLSANSHKSRRVLEITDDVSQPEAKKPRVNLKEMSEDFSYFGGESNAKIQAGWKPHHETDYTRHTIPLTDIKKENNSSNNASQSDENLKLAHSNMLSPSNQDSVGLEVKPHDGSGPKSLKSEVESNFADVQLPFPQSDLVNPTVMDIHTPKVVRISRMDEI